MPNPIDAAMKDLTTHHPADWVRFLGLPSADTAEVISADLSTVSAAADTLIRCGPAVLHLEFQTGPDDRLSDRVLLYNVLARRRTGLPVHSVVFLLQPNTGAVADRVEYAVQTDRGGLSFRFEVVRMWEQPAERFMTAPLGLASLAKVARPAAGQTRADMIPDVVRRIADRVKAEAPADADNIMLCTFLLGGLRYPEDQLWEVYRRVLTVEENVALNIILEDGAVRELRRSILALAGNRFGAPAADQSSRLNGIEDLARLRRLLLRTQQVDSWAALLRGR